ncbi:MAG: polyisoprenoid-binding protein [Ferruginibacter sp.]|nr:polyisoprenoid-binding protein [Ferruginibacter sp.]
MKRISIVLLMAAVVAFSSFTLLETWKLDKAHSQLGFSVTHLGISDVSGYIKSFDVTIKAEKPDYSDAVVELTGDMASINTGIEMRDNHLKGPDFFDAVKYPTINFISTGLKSAGANKYKMTGNLTFHGVTKPITLDLWYRGTAANPQSKAPVAGFQVTGVIKRTDFGIATGFPAAMLGDDVYIKADGEFGK